MFIRNRKIMAKVILVSKGKDRAQIIIQHEGGGSQTKHLRFDDKKRNEWTDSSGKVYKV